MMSIRSGLQRDETPIVRMESDWLRVDVAPSVGGRIVSIREKASGYEFLWCNADLRLEQHTPGAPYDPSFYGGIDELIPNDVPEVIDGVECPDHGELWTMPLRCATQGESLVVSGKLPRFGLLYRRRMTLRAAGPHLDLDYEIANPTRERRRFLWRLHPALRARAGDTIECPARLARVSNVELSRWKTTEQFAWPEVEGERADVIPPRDGTIACLFLFDLSAGRLAWRNPSSGRTFGMSFDLNVFPYVCYFGSYGGFYGHYVIIPEPSSAMPLSVNEAARLGQCTVLEPGGTLSTRVTIHAGS